jgi:hypothetical protein
MFRNAKRISKKYFFHIKIILSNILQYLLITSNIYLGGNNMAITWFDKKSRQCIATITDKHITFNQSSVEILQSVYAVRLGIASTNKAIVVAMLNKDEACSGIYPASELFHVSVHKTYSRVNSTAFMEYAIDKLSLDLHNGPGKYVVEYDEGENSLVIDLQRRVLK